MLSRQEKIDSLEIDHYEWRLSVRVIRESAGTNRRCMIDLLEWQQPVGFNRSTFFEDDYIRWQ